MAFLVNSGNINLADANAWNVIDPTTFTATTTIQESGTTASGTGFVSGVAFTPGAITIDALAFKLSSRNTGSSGVVSVRLINTGTGVAVPGTTVSVVSGDLPNGITWLQFALAAPVTLLAATNYAFQISTSSSGLITPFRKSATASDWTFFLRTTTKATAAATDTFTTCGDYISAGVNNTYTVTMNNTAATTFGSGATGTLAMEVNEKSLVVFGTSAATNYRLDLAGALNLNRGATFRMGTLATPIPASSTALINMIQASNVRFSIRLRENASFTSYGATKTGRANLAADAAAAATSITTDISTGWLTGDRVVVATTTRTATESELRTLAVDASGTTVTVPALTFAHGGTGTTVASVINLTRNVKIAGTSTTLQTAILIEASAVATFGYTEFQFLGSNTANLRGIDVTSTALGSASFVGCALSNFEVSGSLGIQCSTAGGVITISDCVFFRISNTNVLTGALTTGTFNFNNLTGITTLVSAAGFSFGNSVGTISNITAVGSVGTGVNFSAANDVVTAISNITAYASSAVGVAVLTNNSVTSTPLTITNINAWRNNTTGITVTGCLNIVFNTFTAFGNTTSGITISGCSDCRFLNGSVYAGTTLTQPLGLNFSGTNGMNVIADTVFGSPSTHATADTTVGSTRTAQYITFRNCLFGSTTEISTQTNMLPDSYIGSARHDQTSGTHRMWRRFGTITSDTTIFFQASPSQRLTPNNATNKLITMPKIVAVPSGRSATIRVSVRKSVVGDGTAYNGNQPRLILLADSAAGVTTDTVLATATNAANGAFETLTATTPAITDNAAFRFVIDCDGTTGWVNVDYWLVDIV